MPPNIDLVENAKYGTYTDYAKVRTDHIATAMKQQKVMRNGVNGHYGFPDFPPGRDVGGSFHIDAATTLYGACMVGSSWGYGPYTGTRYEGAYTVDTSSAVLPFSTLDLNAYGATAYNKMKPTKPSFQALNALVELREVPMMLKSRFDQNDLKNISKWHIALQFGWLPLLRDCQNLVRTQMNGQKRLEQLLRDNGKPVRRSVALQDDFQVLSQVDQVNDFGLFPIFPYMATRSPRQRVMVTSRDRVWATARYRYWLPPGPRDINWRRRMIAAIFGFQPTPSVVYNAIPWSWLVDWFSNTGDIIANLDAGVADRLAADYFYIMRHIQNSRQTTTTGWYRNQNGEEFSASGTSLAVASSKMRGQGDPFGWNIAQNSLNGMQLSILGALGISRLRL